MPLTEAVELEAQLNPDVESAVTILDNELVRYGADALAASTEAAPTPRPRLESARPVRRGMVLRESLADGSGVLAFDDLLIQIPTPLHERFGLRSIPKVDLYEADDHHLVVGDTGEADSMDRLTVIGLAAVVDDRA